MNTEDIIRWARESGLEIHERADCRLALEGMDALIGIDSTEKLQRFFNLATTKEREARQAAQIENEELKARLARADLEQQRAVLAEREACAKVCEMQENRIVQTHPARVEFDPNSMMVRKCAAAIRARSQS
jgi:hypothetical protein